VKFATALGSGKWAHDDLHFDKVSTVTGAGEWLEQWLYSLEIDIPNISQESEGFQINITGGLCRHFKVAAIESSESNDIATIGAHGMAASCSLNWSVKRLHFPVLSNQGEVVATVSDSTLGGALTLLTEEAKECNCQLPAAIRADQCSGDMKVSDLHFGGRNILHFVLELLRPFLKRKLNQVLGPLICKQLDDTINMNGSEAIANASWAARKMMNATSVWPSKPRPLPEPRSDFIDLGGNPATGLVQQLLDRVLMNPHSAHNFNALLRMLSPGGILSLASGGGLLPLNWTVALQNLGFLNITLEAITLSGLDTLSKLTLQTLSPQHLALAVALQNFTLEASINLQVVPRSSGSSPVHGGKLIENFNVSLRLLNFSSSSAAFLAVNQSRLGQLAINQLAHIGCVGPAVYSAMVTQSNVSLPASQVLLSPLLNSNLEQDVDAMINVVLAMLLDQFHGAMSAIANHSVAVPLRDMVNNATEEVLRSGAVCPEPDPTFTYPAFSSITRVAAIVLAVLGFLAFPACTLVRRRRKTLQSTPVLDVRQCAPTSSETPGDESQGPHANHTELVTSLHDRFPSPEGHRRSCRCCLWDCLACHPRVNPGFRWGLPILAVTLICLFAESNSGVGTTVHLNVFANGKSVANVPSVFSFSLISSVKDMWESKAYALALLIAVFSGIWPYTKLLLMLVCWFAPTSKVSATRRQSVLEFLDEWGKWSLIDVFVMVLFMVGFKFELSATDSVFPLVNQIFEEAEGTASVIVYIRADPGFYGFVIATLASLAVGHMMSANHRYALQLAEYSPAALAVQSGRARLCNKLHPPGFAARRTFVYGPVLALSISLTLVLVGLWVDSFQFTFEGLAAYVLGAEKSVRPFSVMSLGLAVPGASSEPNSFGTRSLQLLFLTFVAFVVVTYHVMLIVLWCAPLSHRLQTHFFVASQVLSAWSGLDVFVVSIFACIMQVEQVAKRIIGHKCDFLNEIIEKLPVADKIPGPKTCFDLVSELQAGFWILFAAAVISSIMGRFMIARCKSALCLLEHENAPLEHEN